jgi:hypothetical protein
MDIETIINYRSGLARKTFAQIQSDLEDLGETLYGAPGSRFGTDFFMEVEYTLSAIHSELDRRDKVPSEILNTFIEIRGIASNLSYSSQNGLTSKEFFADAIRLGQILRRIAPKIGSIAEIIAVSMLSDKFWG